MNEAAAPRPGATLPRPQLLACDIDGTILDERGELRDVVGRALAMVSASGVEVVLATGRSPWSGIAELCDRLGLDGPQVTMQGALISQPSTGRIHRLRTLPPSTYIEAIGFADEVGIAPLVGLHHGHRSRHELDGADRPAVPFVEGRAYRPTRNLERLADERPIRVYLPTGPYRHDAVCRLAARRLGNRVSLVATDTSGVEIMAPRTNKGEAVDWLASRHGLTMDDVAAVGDAANDVELLRAAGRSAAMGAAPPAVRSAADIVVPPSSRDGVLDALAWFFPDLAPFLRTQPGSVKTAHTYSGPMRG